MSQDPRHQNPNQNPQQKPQPGQKQQPGQPHNPQGKNPNQKQPWNWDEKK